MAFPNLHSRRDIPHRSPANFSSAIAACRDLLQRGSASPREAAPARPLLLPPLRVPLVRGAAAQRDPRICPPSAILLHRDLVSDSIVQCSARPPAYQGLLKTHVSSVCFLVFQRYVASVSNGCCKSRSECCICCNRCTRVFQVYVLNVSSGPDVCCNCFI